MSSDDMPPRVKQEDDNTDHSPPKVKVEDEDMAGQKRTIECISSYDLNMMRRKQCGSSTEAEDEAKRQKRMAANRRSAAASRQRRLDLIEDLKKSVAELNKTIADLRRENQDIRNQLQMHNAAMLANAPRLGVGAAVFADHHRMGVAATPSGSIQNLGDGSLPSQLHVSAGVGRNPAVASTLLQEQQRHTLPASTSPVVPQGSLSRLPPQPDPSASQASVPSHEDLQRQLTRQQQELNSVIQALQSGRSSSQTT